MARIFTGRSLFPSIIDCASLSPQILAVAEISEGLISLCTEAAFAGAVVPAVRADDGESILRFVAVECGRGLRAAA